MRFVAVLALASISLTAFACAAPSAEPAGAPAEELEDDIVSGQKQSCGANYTPALRKYELAVIAAKAVRAKDVCNSVTNPKDNASTDATHESVGELLQQAIATCGAFRDVYNTSPYAAPAREVLADSLLGNVAAGTLDTKTFAGLDKAIVGKKMWGPKPGVAHMFDVTFGAAGKATFQSYDFDKGDFVSTSATYSVKAGANPEITIVSGGVSTVYTPRFESGHVVFVPKGEGHPISTSSDPCSA